MSWHPPSVSVVLVMTAVIANCVAIAAWRRRAAPGALALVFLMVAIAEWTLTRGLELAAVGVPQKLVWARLRYIGVVSVSPLWLTFALGYARQVTLGRLTRLALWVIPVISMGVALTSAHHRLLWTSIAPSPSDPTLLVYGHGPWFWVVIAYSYVLIAIGSGAIALSAARLPGAFAKQSAALLFSAVVPWLGNILYVTGMIPVPGLDLTPIALTVSGLVTAWVVFQRDLLDLVPLAREVVLDHLVDGVIVLDGRGRIVDVNQAAARFLNLTASACVGAPAAAALAVWPEIVAALECADVVTGTVRARSGAARQLDFRVSLLHDARSRRTGRLISLRDATDRVRAEEALRQSEAHFRAIFEESPDACYLIDREGRFVDANRAAETLIGRSRAQLVGKRVTGAGVLGNGDLRRLAARLVRVAAGEPTGIDEFTVERPDGTRVHVEVCSSRVQLGDRMLQVGVARDITARRRAEQDLRDSEERYRTLVESIEELICIHDLEGRILSVNRATVEQMGYQRAEDLIGHSLTDFLARSGRSWFPAYLQAIARDGRASGLMRVMTARGEARDLEFSNRLGTDARGTPVVWGVSRDVTERRRIERELRALNEQLEQRVQDRTAKLRQSQARFEALAGAAPVGIFRTGFWGEVRYVNEAWCRITGLSADEARGTGYLEVIHPEDRDRFFTPWPRSAADPRVFEFEGRLQRRDGSVAWVMMRTRAETADGHAAGGFVGTLTDITALRVAEEERRKLASLVEDSPELIGIAGMQGRMLYVNAAGRELLGLGRHDDVSGLGTFRFATPEAQALAKSAIAPAVVAGRTWEGETTLRRLGSGEIIDVALRVFPIWDESGQAVRFVAMVARDIRERKHAEAALRDRDEQLRQGQKMEAVGRLAGGVAHDFNNLLTVILGQSALLRRTLSPDDPRCRPTDAIQRAADRAAALTRQLLTFSRKQVLQTAVIDLNEVVNATAGLLRRVIGEDIELSVGPAPRPALFKGDRSQVEQVIMNLAVNARDAMPHGGRLALQIRHAPSERRAVSQGAGARSGPHVVLTVADTGSGMSPEVQARIFEPFFTTKEPGKGTGLGLATVYGIVRQHGGVITVDSELDRGTAFRVAFPALADGAADSDGAEQPALASGRETVLLVEDERDVRAVVRLYLEALGYTVLEATGPAMALDLAAARGDTVDLLLTDVVMPRMSGRELADQLRARRPTLPVLFMSGYSNDLFAKHGVNAAEVVLIEKPFTLEQLSAAVRRVLDSRTPAATAV